MVCLRMHIVSLGLQNHNDKISKDIRVVAGYFRHPVKFLWKWELLTLLRTIFKFVTLYQAFVYVSLATIEDQLTLYILSVRSFRQEIVTKNRRIKRFLTRVAGLFCF